MTFHPTENAPWLLLDTMRTYSRMFTRMEWFRPLTTGRFQDEQLVTSDNGSPMYYAGNHGTIYSLATLFRKTGRKNSPATVARVVERYKRACEAVQRGEPRPADYPKRPLLQPLTHVPHYRTRHQNVGVYRADGTFIRRGRHVLVLIAWCGAPGTGDILTSFWMDGCHLNGNVNDNRLSNLVWGDRRMNARQREEHKRALESGTQVGLFAPGECAVEEEGIYEVDEEFGF